MSPIRRVHSRKRCGKSSGDAEWRAPRQQPPAPEAPLHPVLQMQQNVGNHATGQLLASGALQTPSSASLSADTAEAEADQIAARVTRSQSASVPGPIGGPAGDSNNATVSSGQPFDRETRAFFEPKFGRDLGDVRIHTGADAGQSARAIRARAYTAGDHVAFSSGAYAPHTTEGRELIAHELAHVQQQKWGRARGIQRKPDPSPDAEPKPTTIQDTAKDEDRWRMLVGNAVRSQFNLRGAGVEKSNVRFLDFPDFAKQFPAAELHEKLFTIFFNYGRLNSGLPAVILSYANHPYSIAGTSSGISQLHPFIDEGIKRDYFEAQTRELDVTTGQRFPVQRVKLRELVAMYIAGITDIAPTRSKRKITMRVANGTSDVDTLVHETCHFYVSDAFRDWAKKRTDGNDFLGGAFISQVLFEGFAEHFTREVMEANTTTFGPAAYSYPAEAHEVWRLEEAVGENTLRAAYFGGDAAQIKRLAFALDLFKTIHPDLLVPPSYFEHKYSEANQPADKKP
jgi:hypothetical protein